MVNRSGEGHERRRLENLKLARETIRRSLRQVWLQGYVPGQVWYNLNEYPTDRQVDPNEHDEQLLAEYAAHGVELIKVHKEWNDSLERYGADKFSPYDPSGWAAFIRLAHRQRLRIIPHVSSGYLDCRSRHYNPAWVATGNCLEEMYWRYAYMSPRSPGWRAFFLEQVRRILVRDGVDGIYNEMGFYPYREGNEPLRSGQVDAFEDQPDCYESWEDFLGQIQALVRRHGGITVNHFGGAEHPPCRRKFYDYLCIGQGGTDLWQMRERAKHWEPYTLIIADWSRLPAAAEPMLYAHCIPYLLFPILCGGRPMTGERAACPGVQYRDEFWFQHCQRIAAARRAGAAPTFGWWDAVPGRPALKDRWYHYLKLYRPMTADGTHAFLEVREASFLGGKPPADVVCSAFVNQDFFLAVANYGNHLQVVRLGFEVDDLESGQKGTVLELVPGTLCLLRKA